MFEIGSFDHGSLEVSLFSMRKSWKFSRENFLETQENQGCRFQGECRRRQMFQLENNQGEKESSFIPCFILFRPPTDWMRST